MTNMKKTLKNLVLGATFVGALMSTGCEKDEIKKDRRLPEVRTNQCLILHPDYLNGSASLGYTLLGDIDQNGDWDLAERYHAMDPISSTSRKALDLRNL